MPRYCLPDTSFLSYGLQPVSLPSSETLQVDKLILARDRRRVVYDTLARNPAILCQCVSILMQIRFFWAYLDEKTAISLSRCVALPEGVLCAGSGVDM
jgi:hypothetical protein